MLSNLNCPYREPSSRDEDYEDLLEESRQAYRAWLWANINEREEEELDPILVAEQREIFSTTMKMGWTSSPVAIRSALLHYSKVDAFSVPDSWGDWYVDILESCLEWVAKHPEACA